MSSNRDSAANYTMNGIGYGPIWSTAGVETMSDLGNSKVNTFMDTVQSLERTDIFRLNNLLDGQLNQMSKQSHHHPFLCVD
mmetsp:Transcript_39434/g.111819  ORF Transcript_39434/g.111819 Transcript_39434/m.111819 type:complete len:81 (+) Transcript_39434:408-650(+)